jgi:beta-ureidopropionase / N-carbamoyl-L-amino-acid hydrolase
VTIVTLDGLFDQLAGIGRAPASGGYRRFAWTRTDQDLRDWFAATAAGVGLDVVTDRNGNQWAWWGNPDQAPGVVSGSHLDSVPDGGAFDGPLGVVSALAAVAALRADGLRPARPIGVVNFVDEEGARFGVACGGSRLLTGALAADRALGLRDGDGITLAEALRAAGQPTDLGRDEAALRRVAAFVELHVEQGKGLAELDAPLALASGIWPHGRWRAEMSGEANHAGTTRLADRRDPTLDHARLVLAARRAAERHGALATCGKVVIEPNGVNAIPARVTAWLDARGPDEQAVRDLVAELATQLEDDGQHLVEESWTPLTSFDGPLTARLAGALGEPPILATGAGHDAGILAAAGVPSAMVFVRNPTGVSHSPAEFAERNDCLAGLAALTAALRLLAS